MIDTKKKTALDVNGHFSLIFVAFNDGTLIYPYISKGNSRK